MSAQEFDTVVLTLDDDDELECAILNIFNCDNKQYIALFPQGDNQYAKNAQVFLYRYITSDDSIEPELENILDDEEYERVATEYDHIVAMEEHEAEQSDLLQ
ncbi:MAG: DUF1292 domain-containing protein [Hespellia sp.]|nr:DUF1292 domain-containing protein [Hespellia sp.]